MLHNIYYTSSDGVNTVHGCLWMPEGEVKGIFQIVHGMCEYAARYSAFAEYLASNGYMVCAEDHLGHGETAKDEDALGFFDAAHDYKTVLKDIRHLEVRVREKHPDVPYYILGHSMGSFLVRAFLAEYPEENITGAIIMGTGFQGKGLLNMALMLTGMNAAFRGWTNRSGFIKSLAFGSYNKKWGGKGFEWLSVNEDNVKAYDADPLCGFSFTDNGYSVLFHSIKAACAKKTFKATPKDLPIYLVSGKEDPVGGYGKQVQKVYAKLVKSGHTCVQMKLYEGARHEILNDFTRDEARADILAFIDGLTAAGTASVAAAAAGTGAEAGAE
ncbi:MAG: alpha/beta hydrolase [Clostridia bacterium]|nr:alpha/beta hydrolase [Clostridia bacterium]